jgi:hypothetical protein
MPEETTVAVEQPTALPDDFATYVAMRNGKPAETPVAEPVAEQPPSEAPADKPEVKSDPDSDPEAKQDEQPRDDQGKFKSKDEDDLPKGVQKRIQKEIDKAVRARKEAEELLRQAREESAKRGTDPAPKPEPAAATTSEAPEPPNINDFDRIEDWQKASAKWMREQASAEAKRIAAEAAKSELEARDKRAAEEAAKAKQSSVQEQFRQRLDVAKKQHQDFDEVVEDFQIPSTDAGNAMWRAFMGREDGAELLYHMAANPEEATRLARLSPDEALMELGVVALSLKPKPKPAPRTTPVSAAPPPMKTVAPVATAVPVRDPEKMNFTEYKAYRERQMAKR